MPKHSWDDPGCGTGHPILMLLALPLIVASMLADKYKIDSCALMLLAGLASYAALAYGVAVVLT